jgi:glutaredoxin
MEGRGGLAARSDGLYLRGAGVSIGGDPGMIRLTLYGRADCHLCHEMRRVVDEVVRNVEGVDVVEVDVDEDPALVRAYGDDVPVLCVNGVRAFAHGVDAAALRARLARERA